MIWELRRSYCLINPCKQVVIVHEHMSEIRVPRRVRLNGIRNGRSVPRVIPAEILEGEDLVEWLPRIELEEAQSREAYEHRRRELQAFVYEWER